MGSFMTVHDGSTMIPFYFYKIAEREKRRRKDIIYCPILKKNCSPYASNLWYHFSLYRRVRVW
jgi:hypothetical protein